MPFPINTNEFSTPYFDYSGFWTSNQVDRLQWIQRSREAVNVAGLPSNENALWMLYFDALTRIEFRSNNPKTSDPEERAKWRRIAEGVEEEYQKFLKESEGDTSKLLIKLQSFFASMYQLSCDERGDEYKKQLKENNLFLQRIVNLNEEVTLLRKRAKPLSIDIASFSEEEKNQLKSAYDVARDVARILLSSFEQENFNSAQEDAALFFNRIARIFRKLDLYSQAIECHEKAHNYDTSHIIIRHNYAITLSKLNDVSSLLKAADLLENSAARDKFVPCFYLAEIYLKLANNTDDKDLYFSKSAQALEQAQQVVVVFNEKSGKFFYSEDYQNKSLLRCSYLNVALCASIEQQKAHLGEQSEEYNAAKDRLNIAKNTYNEQEKIILSFASKKTDTEKNNFLSTIERTRVKGQAFSNSSGAAFFKLFSRTNNDNSALFEKTTENRPPVI